MKVRQHKGRTCSTGVERKEEDQQDENIVRDGEQDGEGSAGKAEKEERFEREKVEVNDLRIRAIYN